MGFCCGWPDGLELSTRQSPGSGPYYRQLQALVENVLVLSIPVQLAHLMCYDDVLYKFTFYLLTYLEVIGNVEGVMSSLHVNTEGTGVCSKL